MQSYAPAEESSVQERKLYEPTVALEEGADFAEFAPERVEADEAKRLRGEAAQLCRHSAAVRGMIEKGDSPELK